MNTYAPSRKTPILVAHGHRAAQGFCTVCGTVWPCWRALREDVATTTANVS
jgi:hypothetical protein